RPMGWGSLSRSIVRREAFSHGVVPCELEKPSRDNRCDPSAYRMEHVCGNNPGESSVEKGHQGRFPKKVPPGFEKGGDPGGDGKKQVRLVVVGCTRREKLPYAVDTSYIENRLQLMLDADSKND